MASNRRRHTRIKASGVSGHLKRDQLIELGLAIENISMGGVFVRTHEPMAVGSLVALEITRAGSKKSALFSGKVVAAIGAREAKGNSPGMGIAFEALTPEQRAYLDALLAQLEVPGVAATSAPGAGPESVVVPEGARLMVQVKGLLMELGDLQTQLRAKEAEVERLKSELEAKTKWISELEAMVKELQGD